MDKQDPIDSILEQPFPPASTEPSPLPPFRLLSLFVIGHLACLGCRRETAPHDHAEGLSRTESFPAISTLIARSVTSLNLGNIDRAVESSPLDSFCTEGSDSVVCNSESGAGCIFKNWKTPASLIDDGDGVRFHFRGRLSFAPRIRIVEAQPSHDEPSLLLWDSRFGRIAVLSLDDDSTWVSSSRKTMVLAPSGIDRPHPNPVRLFTGLDDIPYGWTCRIAPDSIRVDSVVHLASGAPMVVHPDSLVRFPAMGCRYDTSLWRRGLPSKMRRPGSAT